MCQGKKKEKKRRFTCGKIGTDTQIKFRIIHEILAIYVLEISNHGKRRRRYSFPDIKFNGKFMIFLIKIIKKISLNFSECF